VRVLPWAAAVRLVATLLLLLLLAKQALQSELPPAYPHLTFEEGTVYSTRFAPDLRSIVYGAAWNHKPAKLR
jgi:hypothetical protein